MLVAKSPSTRVGGKQSLAEFVARSWGSYTNLAMNMNNFCAVGVKSCGKLYLIENEYGITPMVIKRGQWFDIELLKNYLSVPLTTQMAKTLTKDEVKDCLVSGYNQDTRDVSKSFKTKTAMIDRIVELDVINQA